MLQVTPEEKLEGGPSLKLDKRGLPLVPEPSDHIDDPLNWPLWKRAYCAVVVSTLAFVCQVASALVNPAFVPISKYFGITVTEASYSLTVYILFLCAPMFIAPLAQIYGRRITYLTLTLVAIGGNAGSGASSTWGGVLTGRVFGAVGGSVAGSIGAVTICDLFTQGERGVWMGFYVLCINQGPHVAPVMGGYIAQNLGWRWCFYMGAIFQAFLYVIIFFTFPETLFSRKDFNKLEGKSYLYKLVPHGKVLDRKPKVQDFLTPYRMMKYWTVLLPAIYYGTVNCWGSALFAVTGSYLAAEMYHFNTARTGLLMGIPLTIGCTIGECMAGWISDVIINSYARRHNGRRKPEVRLFLLPLALTLNIGVIVYGILVERKASWIGLAVCMGVAGIGVQIATTVVYTYCTDSYKPQSAELGAVLNLFKQLIAFNLPFYALPFGQTKRFGVSFGVLGALNFAFMLPLFYLIFKGEQIREKQGLPEIHQDL